MPHTGRPEPWLHVFRPLQRSFPLRISLNPGKTMAVLAALAHYHKLCEQEIAAGEVWPLRRVIQTIQDLQAEIGSLLFAIDAALGKPGAGARRSADPNSAAHKTTSYIRRRYSVVVDLDPDEFTTLTEALTRLLLQCEHDPHNNEMKPFGSEANAELSASVRDDLIRAFRKTWLGPRLIPRFGPGRSRRRIRKLIKRNFPLRISLNPGKTMVVLAALEHYRRLCEQEIAAGEVWPLRRVIQTIQDLLVEIGSRLFAIDAELGKPGAGTRRSADPNSEPRKATSYIRRRYSVVVNLDPDEFTTLTEALTRLLLQCEHDRHNNEMKPFGSKANAESSASVRDDLIRAFRKTWRKRSLIPRFGPGRFREIPLGKKAMARYNAKHGNSLIDEQAD